MTFITAYWAMTIAVISLIIMATIQVSIFRANKLKIKLDSFELKYMLLEEVLVFVEKSILFCACLPVSSSKDEAQKYLSDITKFKNNTMIKSTVLFPKCVNSILNDLYNTSFDCYKNYLNGDIKKCSSSEDTFINYYTRIKNEYTNN